MNEAGGERGGGVAVTVSGSSRTSAGVAAKTPTSSSRFYPTPQAVPVAPKARKVIGEWTLTKTLGEGSMGKVKLAVNSISGEKRACKIISISHNLNSLVIGPTTSIRDIPASANIPPPPSSLQLLQRSQTGTDNPYYKPPSSSSRRKSGAQLSTEARIIREAAIMLLLDHPHVVNLHDILLVENYYYLFFEFVSGGQMLDFIISHGRMKEKAARKFFRQILSAVDYCHQNSIVHRDLKIENILIDKNGGIKIIDFGLSNLYSPTSHLSTFCGSLYFAAPELLSSRTYIGPEVDLWSLGVILFVLVCGHVPFDDSNMAVLHAKIKAGVVEYPSYLSHECKNIISLMLQINPGNRGTMDDIKNHQWIVKGYDGPPDNFLPTRTRLDTPLNPEVIARMKGFGFGTDDEIAAQLEEFILRQNFSKTMTSFFESSSPKSAYPTAGTPGSLSHSPSLISTNSTTGAILNNSASQGHISGLADGGGAAVNPTSQSSTSISTSSSSGAAIAALRTNLPPPLTTTTTASSTTKTGFFKSGSFSPQKFDLQRVGLKLLALKTEKAGKSSQGMIFPDNPIVNIYHLVAEKLERESALKALNVAANNASASGIAGSSGDHSNSRSTASGPQQQNFKEDASDADYFRSSIDSRPADMDDRGLLSSDEESPYRGRALTEPSSPAESGEDIRASEDDARAVSGLRLSRPESASLIRSVGGGSAAAQQSSSAHYKPAFKRRVRASSAGELDNFPSVAVGESTSGSKGGGLKEIVDKNRKRIKLPRRKKKRSRRNKKSRRGGVGGEDVVGEKGHWSDGELDSRSTRRDQPEKGGTGGVKQLMSAALKKLGRSAFNKTKSKSNPDNLLIVNSYNGNSNVPAASQLGPTGTGLTTTDTENEIMLSDSNGEFVNLDPSSPERPETNSSTVGIGGDGISAKKKSTKKRFKRVFQGGSSSTSAASVPPTPIDTIRPKSPPPQLLDIDTPGAAAPSAVIHSSALANLEETTSAAALVPRRESIAKSLFNRRLSLSSSMPFNIKDLGVFGPSSGTAAYTSSPLSTSSPPPPPLNENSTALRSSSSSAAAGKSLAAEREGAATSAFTTTAAVTVATIAHDAGVIDTEDGDEVDDQSQASAFPAPLSPIRSPLQAFDAEAAAGIEAPTGNILPMGGRADKKIKSVFLKGLFSVKNSSSKRAGLIRSDLIRVFENIGIQFEEWDGFFKCRFSQKVIVGTPRNLSPPKKAKSTHLTVKSSAISAAATLSSSYSQVSMGMASSSTTAGSNSTGVPAELVDLLQHDRGCGIVRGPTGYNSPKSAPRSEPGSPLAADLDEDEYSVVSASPAPPPLPTRPPLPPLPLPTPIPVTGDSVLAVSALIPQSSDATTSAAAVKESMPLYTSFTGNQNQQAASSAAVGTALQVASLFSSSSSSLEDEEEEANLGGVRRRDVRDDTEEEDNEEQEEFVLAPTYGSSPEKAIDATTATTSTTSPLILPPVASLAISTTTTSPAVDITGITSSSAAAVIGGGVVAVGASTSSGVSSPAQVTTPNLVRRIGERFNATTTNTVNSTSTHHTHYDEDLPAELVLPEGIDLVMRQVIFEVYIVKIGWLGLHGVQFRRISGDSWQYKKICHSILDKLRL